MTHNQPSRCLRPNTIDCPNAVTIAPDPPRHNGGIACGCPVETALEAAEKAVLEARRLFYKPGDPASVDALIRAVRHHDAERLRGWAVEADRKGDTDFFFCVDSAADRLDPEVEDQ